MKCVVCDVCNQVILNNEGFVRIKINRFRFDTYNMEYHTHKYRMDICMKCKYKFEDFVKLKNENQEASDEGNINQDKKR